ncbi:MAG: DUF484 family protein, partial [Alphaproteobacteria bacterium]|nr:DUF484 family protein [Alphaproteobacteria bacterium]
MPHETSSAQLAMMTLMPGDVRDYLLEHPDFLADNGDLFTVLVPPDKQHGDKVQDFQQYMLLRLQDHYTAIKDEHDDLMLLMQEHLQRQSRFNDAMLALLDAESFEDLVRLISSGLALELDQEAVALMIESNEVLQEGDCGGLRIVPQGFVDKWLGDRNLELAEQTEATSDLFGDKGENVRSRALLRLSIHADFPAGLLALGHSDPMYYSTGL